MHQSGGICEVAEALVLYLNPLDEKRAAPELLDSFTVCILDIVEGTEEVLIVNKREFASMGADKLLPHARKYFEFGFQRHIASMLHPLRHLAVFRPLKSTLDDFRRTF
jgi:hypothetical protein